jgi:IS4 transposase
MGLVVCQIHPSVNAAYVDRKEEIGVTIKSVYDKLKGIEPAVSRALVRDTAARMQAIITQAGGIPKPAVAGYRIKIVDGNHLRRTDRRIGELRDLNAAPLPGQALVVFDPQYRLVVDVLPCEDGHAQERSLLPELLEIIESKDLWIADRNFCTILFIFGIASRDGKFIIRQHGNLPYVLKGRRKRVGETETGIVYEQAMEVTDGDGNTRVFRRITMVLHEPTRDGDTEIHIVSNLPKRVGAVHIAELYRDRWQIETAFQEVAESLEGEIKTLGYPKAALFGFCMALVTYNLLSVVRAAVRVVHGEEAAHSLSTYYLANEVASTHVGMSVVLEAPFWKNNYAPLTPTQMANELKRLARNMRLTKYKKAKWTPKKKQKKKMNKKQRNHVSTARVLQASRVEAPNST